MLKTCPKDVCTQCIFCYMENIGYNQRDYIIYKSLENYGINIGGVISWAYDPYSCLSTLSLTILEKLWALMTFQGQLKFQLQFHGSKR